MRHPAPAIDCARELQTPIPVRHREKHIVQTEFHVQAYCPERLLAPVISACALIDLPVGVLDRRVKSLTVEI